MIAIRFPRGFRRQICGAQVSILTALGVTKDEAQLIMGGNLARLLDRDWSSRLQRSHRTALLSAYARLCCSEIPIAILRNRYYIGF